MNKSIVIGSAHHNTLGLIRSLGIKGVNPDVYLISPQKECGCVKSKYINSIQYFDSVEDIVDFLKLNKSDSDYGILFASSDSVSATIDKHYEELKDHYCFFNTEGKTSSLMNKETMCDIATSVGLNVPQHIVFHTGDVFPKSVAYPCITKAISSIDGDKSDTTICQNEDELKSFLGTPNLCTTIQIEKFIEKNFEFQFIGLSLKGGEEIVIPGHTHIDRPKGIQNTFAFEYRKNDDTFTDTIEKTKAFIKRTGYSGLFSVEFLRGKDGLDYFLEMNFRNDGNAICVTDAGYNLPFIWYLWASKRNYKNEIESNAFNMVRYCPERTYVLQCTYGEVPLTTFFKTIFRANSFTEYYHGDSPWFWTKFTIFAIKQLMIKRTLISLGFMNAPKESIG